MIHIKTWMCRVYVIFTMLAHAATAYGAFEYLKFGWSTATANVKGVNPYWDHLVVKPAQGGTAPSYLLSMAYQKPFQGLDLDAGSLALHHATYRRGYHHQIAYFGDKVYRELKISSTTVWPMHSGLMLGLSIEYYRMTIPAMVSQQNLSLSVQTGIVITDDLRLGSVLGQLVQINNGLVIPQEFHFGGRYTYGLATLMIAFEKEAALPAELCVGVLLSPWSNWEFGFGYRDLSGMSTAGWRCSLAKLALFYVYQAHPVLPVSQGFGIEYQLP